MISRSGPVAWPALLLGAILIAPAAPSRSAPPLGRSAGGRGSAGVGRMAGSPVRSGVVMGSLGSPFGGGRGFRNGFFGRFGGRGFNHGFGHGFRTRFCPGFSSSFGGFCGYSSFGTFPYSYAPFSTFGYPFAYGGFDTLTFGGSAYSGYPYAYSGFAEPRPSEPNITIYEVSPPARTVDRVLLRDEEGGRSAYAAPDERLDRAAPRRGERYYLEPRGDGEAREAAAPSPIEAARRRLRVEEADRGVYLVRWTGPAEELKSFELQAVDERGEELHVRLLHEPPFRTLIHVPGSAAAVLVTLVYRNGTTLSLKLPAREFRALADRRPDPTEE